MTEGNIQEQNPDEVLTSRFPTAYTVLFLLIAVIAALTWNTSV